MTDPNPPSPEPGARPVEGAAVEGEAVEGEAVEGAAAEGAPPIERVAVVGVAPEDVAVDQGPPAAGAHPTAPVSTRPPVVRPRPRRGPLTRMGPWAPVAGALLGFVLGTVAVLLLAGTADGFRERLSLVLLVVGLGMLGASGTLLADEVRLVRRGIREAAVRPAWVETTAGLLNGLTPARLLLLTSGFVLFLAAYVARG
jgi:hypothetical protein